MARAIIAELRDIGVDVWTGIDIEAGAPWAGAVINAIDAAGFLIVDLTGFDPNTMYELGYAHAIRKPVLMLIKEEEGRVPRDLAGFLYFVYRDDEIASFPRKIRRFVEDNFITRLAA